MDWGKNKKENHETIGENVKSRTKIQRTDESMREEVKKVEIKGKEMEKSRKKVKIEGKIMKNMRKKLKLPPKIQRTDGKFKDERKRSGKKGGKRWIKVEKRLE